MISISLNFKWLYWLIILIIIIIVIWVFLSRSKSDYEFVGYGPLIEHDYKNLESRWNRHPPKRSSEYSSSSTQSKASTRTPEVTRRHRESNGEHICRKVLTKIYKQEFSSCRPDFLKNPRTRRNLELDGYNEKLGIAFEYNGAQHYEFPNRYHKNQQEFEEQVKRDRWKLDQCEYNGIYLIRVPYTVPLDKIERYIKDRLPQFSLRSYQ